MELYTTDGLVVKPLLSNDELNIKKLKREIRRLNHRLDILMEYLGIDEKELSRLEKLST